MSGRIALLAVAILTLCGLSAEADSELRRKRRVLQIDSVDDGHNNLHSLTLMDSDLWGRHLAVGSPDGDSKKGGKRMMGMMMDGKKSKGAMGSMKKGAMGGMMMSKMMKKDVDGLWDGMLGDLSMSLPDPTPSPTRAGAVVPTPTNPPVAIPTPAPSTATEPPVATAPPTSVLAFPTRAPVVPTEMPAVPTETPSLSPFTVCNAKPRDEAFLSILEDITSASLLNDPNTAQGFAYEFLVSQDPANVDPCTYPTVEQRYAAVTFFRSTNGPDWTNPTGWLTAANECNWYGVRCDGNDGLVTGLLLCK
jgi:hypothetical protein